MAQAVRLFHRRWSVPALAVLADAGPLRFTALAARLQRASRDTLAETLRHLVRESAVERRPAEASHVYALTAAGETLAPYAVELTRVVPAAGLLELALAKWPMLVLAACALGASRYSELEGALPGVTPRALSEALRELVAARLVEATRAPGLPEGYAVAPRAEVILPALLGLVSACAALPIESGAPASSVVAEGT
jgi:DNA-binding HxlR family transcriptional regulator